MNYDIIVAGVGGQGVLSISTVIAAGGADETSDSEPPEDAAKA